MRRFRRVATQTYRHHHLEVLDDRGTGWALAIHFASTKEKVVLRNPVPNGLKDLIREAHRRIDRFIDEADRPRVLSDRPLLND